MIVPEAGRRELGSEKASRQSRRESPRRDVSYRKTKTRRVAPFRKTLRTSRRTGVNPAPTKTKAHRLKPACGRQACATTKREPPKTKSTSLTPQESGGLGMTNARCVWDMTSTENDRC
jgi:hypothetical protein